MGWVDQSSDRFPPGEIISSPSSRRTVPQVGNRRPHGIYISTLESSDDRIYKKYKMAYLPARLFLGLNSPRELVKRFMTIVLYVKCVARVIDLVPIDFGGDFPTSEGFQRAHCEGLGEL